MSRSMPIRTVNPLNTREHWAKRAKRAKQERLVGRALVPHDIGRIDPPYVFRLTRVGPRKMDDDGLSASFKAIRDGIADCCEIDDGSDQIRFEYAQRIGKQYSVECELVSWAFVRARA